MAYSAWAPLAGVGDLVALLARLILGGVMLYYGWPKLKNPGEGAEDMANAGFRPGWLWGTVIVLVEFVGGLAIVAGVYTWLAAALFGFQMLVGTIWKITRHKGFPDWSYDVLLIAIVVMLMAVGPGAYALG